MSVCGWGDYILMDGVEGGDNVEYRLLIDGVGRKGMHYVYEFNNDW